MTGQTNAGTSGNDWYKNKITGTSNGSGSLVITGIPFTPKGYAISASFVLAGYINGQCGGTFGNAYSYKYSYSDEYRGDITAYSEQSESLYSASFSDGTLTVSPAAGSFENGRSYSWAVVG